MQNFFDKNLNNSLILLSGALIFFLIMSGFANIFEVKIKEKNIVPQNLIIGRGESFINAIPDVATFSFTVRIEEKSLKNAQQKMVEITNKALIILDQNAVDKKDIKTENYSTHPRYEYQTIACNNGTCPTTKQIMRGFEASQTIFVKIRDLDKASNILSSVAEIGVTEVSGLSFEVDDIKTIKKKARIEAIEKAKEEAKATAKALNVSLKKIVRFDENDGMNQFPIMRNKSMVFASDRLVGEAPIIEPGTEKINASVSIAYEFE